MKIALIGCGAMGSLYGGYLSKVHEVTVCDVSAALIEAINEKGIIMDEPTTSLTEVEIERVFEMMRTVKKSGVSMVFISHKLGEILTICDSFTVLRDGEEKLLKDVTFKTEEADGISFLTWNFKVYVISKLP